MTNEERSSIELDADGFVGECWCGELNAWHSEVYLETTCGGSGLLACHCGGDQCVCHNHGSAECTGSPDCDFRDDLFDDDDPQE